MQRKLSTTLNRPFLLAERIPPRTSQLTPSGPVRWFVFLTPGCPQDVPLEAPQNDLPFLPIFCPHPSPGAQACSPPCHKGCRRPSAARACKHSGPTLLSPGEGGTELAQNLGLLSPSPHLTSSTSKIIQSFGQPQEPGQRLGHNFAPPATP